MAERALVEPSAVMRQAAKGIHEMFVALVNEGFTEAQALHIVGVVLAAQAQAGGQGG